MGEGEKKRREEEEKEEIKPRSRPKRYGCLDFGMELLTLCMDPLFCWLMVYPKPRV